MGNGGGTVGYWMTNHISGCDKLSETRATILRLRSEPRFLTHVAIRSTQGLAGVNESMYGHAL